MTEHDKPRSPTAKPKFNPKPARGLESIAMVSSILAKSLAEDDKREAKKNAKKMIGNVVNLASARILKGVDADFDEAAKMAESALNKARAVNLLEVGPSEMKELLFNVFWSQVVVGSNKPECMNAIKKENDRLGRSLTENETLKILQKTIPSAFVVRFA